MENSKGVSPILSVRNIKKRFGGIVALDGVSINFYSGEIHCVVGENGAGKSTLMKIIAGIIPKDEGEIIYLGHPASPKSVWDMFKQGIGIILQEPGLIGELTVAENIFLGRERLFEMAGIIKVAARNNAAYKALKNVGVDFIDVTQKVSKLPYEEWKLIELARAVSNENLKVLIVDEATAALSIDGQKILFEQISKLKEQGVAILFISHRLKEVFDIADRITVMKDGRVVKTLLPSDTTPEELPKMMVGRNIEHYYREDSQESYDSEVVLAVRNLKIHGVIRDVSFDLHRGEILGIGGLVGSGMHALGKALFGLLPYEGQIFVRGQDVKITSPIDAIKLGIGYIPRERDKEGLILMHKIKDNISLPNLDQITLRGFLINPKLKRELSEDYKTRLDIKAPSVEVLCTSLSGGNRQKVVVAKWLARDVDIFIMACPTRGIDVGAKAQIYRLMEDLKSKGKAILMISEELPELIGMSDRILIFKEGKLVKSFKRSENPSEEEVVANML